MEPLQQAVRRARESASMIATARTDTKNSLLRALADAIEHDAAALLEANAADLAAARAASLPEAKLARLTLDGRAIAQLATSLRAVAALPDPVGEITRDQTTEAGLRVRKVRSPLGVVCMIYESRPGVTAEAFALCFKSGNACVLKGGKEAARSNEVIARLIRQSLDSHGLPTDAVVVFSELDREQLKSLLSMTGLIDLVIPRGGPELIRFVTEHSRIPTVQHFQGVNHIFVDESADPEQAVNICLTAKTSAPATCNAAECILVHKAIAATFVPRLVDAYTAHGVEVRGGPLVVALSPSARPAAPEDFGREFLSLTVAMRIVSDLEEAIDHIARYGSNHTEAILTASEPAAAEFSRRIEASCVVVNGSTRLNDGFTLGLGAEIGISTSRVHAYGPMGLEELTTQRYLVTADGHTR